MQDTERPVPVTWAFGDAGEPMNFGRDMLAGAMAEALDGHCCASGWLGYANVLFLGFGDVAVIPRTSQGQRTAPPYEVNANKADWRIEGGGLSACADDDRDPAERAVESIIGLRVVRWSVGAGHTLTIEFDGGPTIQVVPWTDPDEARGDAWSVALPGERLVAVSCGGQVAAVDSQCPVGQWFDPPVGTEPANVAEPVVAPDPRRR